MNDDPQSPATVKKHKVEKFLLLVAVLVLMAVLTYCTLDISSAHTWKQFQLQMKAQGESLDFADFIPKPVPDAQNFALTPIVASSYSRLLDSRGNLIVPPKTNIANRLDMEIYADYSTISSPTNHLYGGWYTGKKADLQSQQLYYRALANSEFGSKIFQIPPQAGPAAQDILLALNKYTSQIEELRNAGEMRYSRFPLNYNSPQPYDIEFPHADALEHCNQMLELRALAELQNNQNDQAMADIKLSFRLISSLRSEPFDISQLVRIHMLTDILQPVWEGLNGHTWRADQLISLENDLEKFDFPSDFEFTVRCQRAEDISAIEYFRRTRRLSEIVGTTDNGPDDSSGLEPLARFVAASFYHSIPDSVFYQNEINIAKYIQDWLLPIADPLKQTISPDTKNAADLSIDNFRKHLSPNNFLVFMLIPGLTTESEKFAFAQNSANMAKIACALESYRLIFGNYPQTLDVLVPQYIGKVPHDVINGQPLKYHPTKDGKYVLYSVGWNKTDDGGLAALNREGYFDRVQGDWVWNGTGVTNEMLNP